MSAIKRILVPTDFSPASELALDYAIDLAGRIGAGVHLMHVLEEQSFTASYPDGFFAELPGVRAQMLEDAHRQLADSIARCGRAGIATTSQVAFGSPARAIAEQALRRGTDLIIMGTHGRSGFAHLLLGSVAERVVRTAPCPVLTVRDTARVADMIAADAVQAAAIG
jgi:nucleotide-binding universal stress UspA family protein